MKHRACGQLVTHTAAQVYNHLQKCEKATKETKEKYDKSGQYSQSFKDQLLQQEHGDSAVSIQSIIENMNSIKDTPNANVNTVSKKELDAILCKKYGTTPMTPEHQQQAQQALANWIYSKAIPANALR